MMTQRNKFSSVLMLMIMLSGLAINAVAQIEETELMVDSVNINALTDLKYIQLLGVKEEGKLVAEIDYGVKLAAVKRRITGEDGKPQSFNSIVNVLNFMDKNGWEFLNAFEIKITEGMVYHFLLRRKQEINATLSQQCY